MRNTVDNKTLGESVTTSFEERRNWTAQGSQEASKRTYASIRAALASSPQLSALKPDVFLQGSYANATNTRADSDVDVVVMLTSTFMPDTSLLSDTDKNNHAINRLPGTMQAQEFRRLVHDALANYYGSSRVESGQKCLKIAKNDGYVNADVVPCLQHRLFTAYGVSGASTYVEGVSIDPLSGSRIINYPKKHIENGQSKNARTDQRYKPTVRQIKRLRRKAVDLRLLDRKEAPGYLLESLVFNVPDSYFVADDSDRMIKVLSWLSVQSISSLHNNIESVDRMHNLFQNDPGNHDANIAKRVIDVLWDLV